MFLYQELSLLWGVEKLEDVTPDALIAAHAIDPPPDLLIVGCGDKIGTLPKATLEFFHDTETTLEVLDTVRSRTLPRCPSPLPTLNQHSLPSPSIAAERDSDVQHSGARRQTSRGRVDLAHVVNALCIPNDPRVFERRCSRSYTPSSSPRPSSSHRRRVNRLFRHCWFQYGARKARRAMFSVVSSARLALPITPLRVFLGDSARRA